MHVMFIHPNFPAQFGQLAFHLATQLKWQTTFVTSVDTRHLELPFNHINYKVYEGQELPKVFTNPTTLQGLLDHLLAVYTGLRGAPPALRPDLVVGHMSFGTMLYLRNLYPCPFVGYYDLLPPPFWTDAMILRREFPPPEGVRLFNATHHALTHLHLNACDAAYTPTHWQLNTAPKEWHHKLRVIYDGIDAEFFQPRESKRPVEFRGLTIGPDTRVVTYVSPGLESVRGFDIFMQAAKKVLKAVPNTLFLIAGEERTNYGHELHHLGQQSFKQWVLNQDSYDLTRIIFLGLIPYQDLQKLYNLSAAHVYLTVPYILSRSVLEAMASGCTIVGSATAPVQEVIDNGVHGLLADFYDVEGLADRLIRVLRDPAGHRALGEKARERVLERYEFKKCAGEVVQLFEGLRKSSGIDDLFAALGREE